MSLHQSTAVEPPDELTQATTQSAFEQRLASAGLPIGAHPLAPVWRVTIIDMTDCEAAQYLRCVSVFLQAPSAQQVLDLLRRAGIYPHSFPCLDEAATQQKLSVAGQDEKQIDQTICLGRLGEPMSEFVARFKKDFFENLRLMDRCGQNTTVVVEELLNEFRTRGIWSPPPPDGQSDSNDQR